MFPTVPEDATAHRGRGHLFFAGRVATVTLFGVAAIQQLVTGKILDSLGYFSVGVLILASLIFFERASWISIRLDSEEVVLKRTFSKERVMKFADICYIPRRRPDVLPPRIRHRGHTIDLWHLNPAFDQFPWERVDLQARRAIETLHSRCVKC